ncbi:hypothetical protein I79_007257 [Cricetulus griseus]|uniref:Uncharacterized protein n=1 Tax=Cricetulus griseus TaxID=10029 RepID=G3HA19_CRIGR|nr:hypothetical protein I79_007257 [Cricetulus griseus]
MKPCLKISTHLLPSVKASMWTVADHPPPNLDDSRDLPDHIKTRRVHMDRGPATVTGLGAGNCASRPGPGEPGALSKHECTRRERPHGPNMHRVPPTSLQGHSCERSAKGFRLPGNKAAALNQLPAFG